MSFLISRQVCRYMQRTAAMVTLLLSSITVQVNASTYSTETETETAPIKKTYYSSDYEGILNSFSVIDPSLSFEQIVPITKASDKSPIYIDEEGALTLADGVDYIFGGDLFDRGPDDQQLLTLLLNAKKRYGDRITLIGGNRDYNKLRWPLEMLRHPDMTVAELLAANGVIAAKHWTQGDESKRDELLDWLLSEELLDYLSLTVIAHWHEESATLIHHGDFNLAAFAHIPNEGVEAIADNIQQLQDEPTLLLEHIEQLNAWQQMEMELATEQADIMREIVDKIRNDDDLEDDEVALIDPEDRQYSALALYAGVKVMSKDDTWPSRKHMDVPEWVDLGQTLASPLRTLNHEKDARPPVEGVSMLVDAGVKHVLVGHTPQGHFPRAQRHTIDAHGGQQSIWFLFADTSHAEDVAFKTERRPVVVLSEQGVSMDVVRTVYTSQVLQGVTQPSTFDTWVYHFDSADINHLPYMGKVAVSLSNAANGLLFRAFSGVYDSSPIDIKQEFNYAGVVTPIHVDNKKFALMVHRVGHNTEYTLVPKSEVPDYLFYEPVGTSIKASR